MTKKMKWGIGIAVAVILVSGVAFASRGNGPQLDYETTTMSGTTVRTVVSVVGSVKAEKETKLAFAKTGTVTAVSAKEGDHVSSGQILAELDKTDLLLEVDRTRAAVNVEQNTLSKLRSGMSDNERAVLDNNIRNAQVAIDALRKSLAATKDRTQKEVEEARLTYNNAKAIYEASKTSSQGVNTADITSLQVAVKNAQQSLEATRVTNTQSIQAAQTALDNAKKELGTSAPIQNKNLQDAQERSFYDAAKYLTEADKAQRAINDIITVEDYNKDQNAAYRSLLGVSRQNSYGDTVTAYNALKGLYATNRNLFDVTNANLTYQQILQRLDALRDTLSTAYNALTTTSIMLDNSITSVDLSPTKLNGFKDAVLNERSAISTALAGLATVRQNVENLELQKNSADTTSQNRVDTAQQGLITANAQAAAAELQAQNALTNAQQNLQKAQAGLSSKDIDLQRLQNASNEAAQRLSSAEARLNEQIATSAKSLSDLQAQLLTAQAQKLAQASPARSEDIRIQENRVQQALTALHGAENNLEDAYIRAPKEGIVSKVQVKEGEQASPSTSTISMISEDFSIIETNIAENEIAQVKPGQKVNLTFDAFDPDTIYTGTVTFIDPAQTALDGVIYYRTEISFDPDQYPENTVRPGFSANLDVITKELVTQAIPVQALKDAGDKGKKVDVLIEEGGKKRTEEKFVEVGMVGDDYVEITSGLSPSDKVVLSVTDPSKK